MCVPKTTPFIANNECQGCCPVCDIDECEEEDLFHWCRYCNNYSCYFNHNFNYILCDGSCEKGCRNYACVNNNFYDPEKGSLKDL